MPSSDVTIPLLVKHDFQLANEEIWYGNVYMIQNTFTLFDRNSLLTFNCQLHAVLLTNLL